MGTYYSCSISGRLLVLLIACVVQGCAEEKNEVPKESLTWTKLQRLLESKEVTSIQLLSAKIAGAPLREASLELHQDPARIEGTAWPIEEYIRFRLGTDESGKDTEGEHLGDRAAKVFGEIRGSVKFKESFDALKTAKNVYMIYSYAPDVAQRVASWDKPKVFEVFADGDGVIIGWRISEAAGH